VTGRFRVKGEKRLVGLYKRRMAAERAFKASKQELSMEKPKWRGIAKIRMHVAICYSGILAVAIVANKVGRPELANNIAAFTYQKEQKKPRKQKQAKKELFNTNCEKKFD
jgi:hypothetical protein